jgi:hypothetical protein
VRLRFKASAETEVTTRVRALEAQRTVLNNERYTLEARAEMLPVRTVSALKCNGGHAAIARLERHEQAAWRYRHGLSLLAESRARLAQAA